jgi:carbon-monoxide dehydrogenase medium subunit
VKPPPFAYVDPHTTAQALQALTQYGDEGKLLAGGQSLVPLLNMRLAQPGVIIDLNHVGELNYISPREHDGRQGMAFGAMTRQAGVEAARDVLAQLPLLAEGIGSIGHPQIRSRGTIGGSVAHADPAAELPVLFRALDGVAVARSERGARDIAAADFFLYTFTPALEPDEMLTEVWLPLPPPNTGQAFLEVARRHGDFALISAAVSLTLDGHGVCTDVRIALGGAAPVPARATRAEAGVRGNRASLELFREAGRLSSAEMEPTSDVHADADYRREVAGTLTYRALKLAFERAGRTNG